MIGFMQIKVVIESFIELKKWVGDLKKFDESEKSKGPWSWSQKRDLKSTNHIIKTLPTSLKGKDWSLSLEITPRSFEMRDFGLKSDRGHKKHKTPIFTHSTQQNSLRTKYLTFHSLFKKSSKPKLRSIYHLTFYSIPQIINLGPSD